MAHPLEGFLRLFARADARCRGTQFDPDMVRAFLQISIGDLRRAMGPLSVT